LCARDECQEWLWGEEPGHPEQRHEEAEQRYDERHPCRQMEQASAACGNLPHGR
jgi:hypothetical protein